MTTTKSAKAALKPASRHAQKNHFSSLNLLKRFDLNGLRDGGQNVSPEGTRGRLLTEAVKLFAERGYDACTVRELASAADLAVPSMYNHFESKTDILVASVDYILSEFYYFVLSDLKKRNPFDLLFDIVERHAVFSAARQLRAKTSDSLVAPSFMQRSMPEEDSMRFSAAMLTYVDILGELIDACSPPDPDISSVVRAWAVHELADRAGWWYTPDSGLTPDDIGRQACILVARSLNLDDRSEWIERIGARDQR